MTDLNPSKNTRKKILKYAAIFFGGILILAAVLAGWFWTRLQAGLPQIEGTLELAGLTAPVWVNRDDLGIPTVQAENRLDAARATGFLHAQDRFFQMDLLRRAGAGELAELLGPSMVKTDGQLRFHRLRRIAGQTLALLPAEQRDLLEVYTQGINAGLQSLRAYPPEYLALRLSPRLWMVEDCLLVGYSMFFDLQDSRGRDDLTRDALRKVLPEKAYDFFVPQGTDWEAALDGSRTNTISVPGADTIHFSSFQVAGNARPFPVEELYLGSNNWAVDGTISRTGAALVADDMHLGHRVPNVWYRLRIQCPRVGAQGGDLDITGASLPGIPFMVVGSNRYVAWAFTNSMLDTTDVIPLETDPRNPSLYRTPEGWEKIETGEEILHVRGGANEILPIEQSIWGPVLPRSGNGPRLALRWIAHQPGAINMQWLQMEKADSAEAALRLAPYAGIPAQNLVVGDRQGKIGWTLAGRLPRRIGYQGDFPVSWADGKQRWDGMLPAEEYPRLLAPADGRLWTANNRVSGDSAYLTCGPRTVDIGARARQIRDALFALRKASPTEMLSIQLDDRALFLERWQKLLRETLMRMSEPPSADLQELRTQVEGWEGRASTQSSSYRLVRTFRDQVTQRLLEPLAQKCREVYPDFRFAGILVEGPVWMLLQERPAHLLNPRFPDYDSLLLAAIEETIRNVQQAKVPLKDFRWGQRNLVQIRHPLSLGIPWLSRWLDMFPVELPGDSNMPRFQSPSSGASQRMAVSPGFEEEGIFHMPGGPSGHFLSPFYRTGHDAWVQGKPLPFLPGPARHRLQLIPGNRSKP